MLKYNCVVTAEKEMAKSNRKKHGKVYEVVIDKRRDRWNHWLVMIMFTLALLYWEALLKTSTVMGSFLPEMLFTLLFSVCTGGLCYIVSSFGSSRRNHHVRLFMLLGMAVVFGVNYFVYLQFKIFYDVNTVLAGSSGVLRGFLPQIRRLVLNRNGLLHIAAFLLPVLVYAAVGRAADSGSRINVRRAQEILTASFLSFSLAVGTVLCSPLFRLFYHDQYNFQSAVSSFGLVTGIRLDATRSILGSRNEIAFSTEPAAEPVSEPETETKAPAEEKPVYGKNELAIDFAGMAERDTGVLRELDLYTASQTASSKNEYTGLFKGKNLIFITAEAFSAEVIDLQLTPTLYRLAHMGIQFTDYYQPASAGTTGGEFENIFGMLPVKGGSSLKMTAQYGNQMTMGNLLNDLGYNGWVFHNNDYMFYDRHITHNNLGYSNGYMGYGNGMEEYVQDQWPESDLEMIQGTMPLYLDAQPFNVYYMSVSGHNGYLPGENDMARKNWERVQDLPYSDEVKGYLAANLELEDALAALVTELEARGIADDTVIVLGADHFPYGLDYDAALGSMPYLSELYGFNVTNYLERDHNRLIIWSGCLEKMDPIVVSTPASSIDILPTLCNLFGVEWDSRVLPGRDVLSDAEALVFDLNYDWKTELGTYLSMNGTFTPASEDTVVPEGYVERIRAKVRDKITYCEGVLTSGYFDHIFGTD